MKLVPRSIRGRLLLAGVLLTAIAMAIASFSIDAVLDRFVRRSLDERLDAQIALLLRSVRPDGTVDKAMLDEIGPFTQHRRGWGWRVEAGAQIFTSQEVVRLENVRQEQAQRPERRDRHSITPAPSWPKTGLSEDYYVRSVDKPTALGPVRISVAAPRDLFDRSRRAAVLPVLATLAGLSVVLLLATLLQLQLGLRPLGRLRRALAGVRSGALARVPLDQPLELEPVVGELNGLLDENAAALSRARAHVANLAHSLKTPLASLELRLSEVGGDTGQTLRGLVEEIDGAIRHHLARARSASPGAPGQFAVELRGAVDALVFALRRIHEDKQISAEIRIAPDLAVKCDPQDLNEMLGNLLDNGFKWGSSRLRVGAGVQDKAIRIDIDDDGPGLSEPEVAQALLPGARLDERKEGHGFGLPIARELAELHGGSLTVGVSPLGGLRVTLLLPGTLDQATGLRRQ